MWCRKAKTGSDEAASRLGQRRSLDRERRLHFLAIQPQEEMVT